MTSLRARLGIGLFLSLLAMIGLLWLTVGLSVRLLMEEQVASRLAHDSKALLGGLRFDTAGNMAVDERRIQGIYQQPFSGHYFQVEVAGQVSRSRSLWDEQFTLPEVDVGEVRLSYITGPQSQPLLLRTSGFRKQDRVVRLAVAEDLLTMRAGIRRFQWRLLVWSLGVVFVLLLIQQYIVARSLRPVAETAVDITRLEHGEITALREAVPDEVRPLVRAINTLLQRQQQRLQRSREALGNLAHAVKTPLTVLLQLAREKLPDTEAAAREQLEAYARQITDLMDKSLRQARLAGDSIGASQFDLKHDLPGLIDTLQRLYPDKTIRLRQHTGALRYLPLEQQDGMELLGNLLDNAWKWATSAVELTISGDRPAEISIEDDGPGVADEVLQALTRRGARQDEAVAGYGIGLSVVSRLVEDLGGTLTFARSATLGGLKVGVRLG